MYFSHRPVDVHNVFNAVQVKLLMKSAELSVPEYDEVFRDDDEEVTLLLCLMNTAS